MLIKDYYHRLGYGIQNTIVVRIKARSNSFSAKGSFSSTPWTTSISFDWANILILTEGYSPDCIINCAERKATVAHSDFHSPFPLSAAGS